VKHDLEIRDPKRYQRWIAWDGATCHGCKPHGAPTASGETESGHTYHIHDTQAKAILTPESPPAPTLIPEGILPSIIFMRKATQAEVLTLLVNWHPEYECLGPFPKPLTDGGDMIFNIPPAARVTAGRKKVKVAKQLHLREFEFEIHQDGERRLMAYVYAPGYAAMKKFAEEKIGIQVLGREEIRPADGEVEKN
jgi:hypothetical protein